MGLFEEHLDEAASVYPPVSLFVVAVLFATTGDATTVLYALVVGSALVKIGLVLPDVDSHSSKPRRIVGRLVTWGIVAAALLVATAQVLPEPYTAHLSTVRLIPPEIVAVSLLLGLVLWSGLVSRHRNLSHSVVWGGVVATLVGVLAALVASPVGPRIGALFGWAMAVYCYVGIERHRRLDGVDHWLWDRSQRSYTDHRPFLRGSRRHYPRVGLWVVAVSVVFVDIGILILLLLSAGYLLLVVGATLPHVDRKQSESRRVFDSIVTVGVGAAAGYWMLAALGGVPTSAANLLPQDALLPILFLGLVLWTGRDAQKDSVTHTPAWAAAVAAGAAASIHIFVSWLPATGAVTVAGATGVFLVTGMLLHFHHEATDAC